jgi:hypothetical protein
VYSTADPRHISERHRGLGRARRSRRSRTQNGRRKGLRAALRVDAIRSDRGDLLRVRTVYRELEERQFMGYRSRPHVISVMAKGHSVKAEARAVGLARRYNTEKVACTLRA